MTWIGRSIHCASSIATNVETTSAMSAVCAARVSALRISLRTSSVETPTRIAPNSCVAGQDRLAHLEAALGVDGLRLIDDRRPPDRSKSSSSGIDWPLERRASCARSPPVRSRRSRRRGRCWSPASRRCRFEDRADAAVLAKGRVRIRVPARGRRRRRAGTWSLASELAPPTAVSSRRSRMSVHICHRDHHQRRHDHERRDAGDLFCLDAQCTDDSDRFCESDQELKGSESIVRARAEARLELLS